MIAEPLFDTVRDLIAQAHQEGMSDGHPMSRARSTQAIWEYIDAENELKPYIDALRNPVTVRAVFEKAYGPVPEGASCHVGNWSGKKLDEFNLYPTTWDGMNTKHCQSSDWDNREVFESPLGPDTSQRPGSAFRGFFGSEYDKALDELLEEGK